jgi:hypothetical protein
MHLAVLYNVVPIHEIAGLNIVWVDSRGVAEGKRPVPHWSYQWLPDTDYLLEGSGW